MSRKSGTGAKTPKPVHNPLPPLLKLRGQSETPTNMAELNNYSYVQDNSFNLNSIRKFFTPTNVAKTAFPTSFRSDIEGPVELLGKVGNVSQWEITERVESYNIRIKVSALNNANDEFILWNQCATEIIPLIKRQNQDIGNAVALVTSNMYSLFRDLQKLSNENAKKNTLDSQESLKKIKTLEDEAIKLKNIINDLQDIKRMELDEIKKEINEIFGGEDNEIQLLKLKTKRFQDTGNTGTVEFLRDLYEKMNKDFHIPESKAYDFPSMNIDDYNYAINQKFQLIQKSTASRIYKLFEGKNRNSVYAQTVDPYVNPKDFEDLTAQSEKQNIVYQSVLMQLEKFKNDLATKSSVLEVLEAEKIQISSESTRLRRELELMSKEVTNTKQENDALKEKIEILTNGGTSTNRTLKDLENSIKTQKNKINDFKKSIEKYEITVKEKDEKIKTLEKKLEKRRLNKGEVLEEEKLVYGKPEHKKYELQEPVYENDRFKDMIKPIRSKPLNKSNHPSNVSMINESDSKSTLQDNIELLEPGSSVGNRNISKNLYQQDYIQSPKINSNIPDSYTRHMAEASLPTRVNSRDTPLERVDEYKEIKQGSQENRIKYHVNIKPDQKPPLLNDSARPRRKKNLYEKNSPNESEDEYQLNRSMQWELTKSRLDSKDSKRNNEFEIGEERILIGKDGLEYTVIDKCVWTTNELKYLQITNFSKGIQVSENLIELENKNNTTRNIYFLPYNPNNTYGLRGDNYMHTQQKIFHAQPRIPDLSSSIFFQSPYFLEKDRENKQNLGP